MRLIDLRTRQDKLVGKLEPDTLRLHVVHRGESMVFDLRALAELYSDDVVVRHYHPKQAIKPQVDRG